MKRLFVLGFGLVLVMLVVRPAISQNDDQDVLRILPDGQWARSDRKHGTVYWSESSLHVLRNVGKTTSHTIRVELKY
jgi:hypothetical protein